MLKEIYALNYNQLKVESLWPGANPRPIRQQFLNDWRRWTEKDQASYGQSPSTSDVALQISPRFYVVKDGNLVQTAAGIGGWKTFVVPTLRPCGGRLQGRLLSRGPSHLDGNWTVVQICQDQPQAKGYELRFDIGRARRLCTWPVWTRVERELRIVSADRSGRMEVVESLSRGIDRSRQVQHRGERPRTCHIVTLFPARFSGSEGKGVRTQGRPCTFLFKKL